jgi:hypothetical protein
MAIQVINVGASPNDGTGDAIRTSFVKCNDNFDELYNRLQETVPATAQGSPGDIAGMTAADSNYFYWCIDTYDGSTAIWRRVAGSSW